MAMSLLLSQQYTTLQEFGFLMVFLVVVALAAAISLGLRPPRVLALLGRSMHEVRSFLRVNLGDVALLRLAGARPGDGYRR